MLKLLKSIFRISGHSVNEQKPHALGSNREIPSSVDLSRAEFTLLAQFRNAKSLIPSGINDFWEAILKKDPQIIISQFIEHGWIIKAPLEEHVMRLSVNEMKSRLKSLGQRVSGNKSELAKRLIETQPNIASSLSGETLWQCSASALPPVLQFLENEDAVEQEARKKARQALDNGDLSAAAEIAAADDAQKLSSLFNQDLFPPLDAKELCHRLELVESSKDVRPPAFQNISDELFNAALDVCMWSSLRIGKPKRERELEALVLNLEGWSTNKAALEGYRRSEAEGIISGVKMLWSDDCEISLQHKELDGAFPASFAGLPQVNDGKGIQRPSVSRGAGRSPACEHRS
jgi:hypothetical protein